MDILICMKHFICVADQESFAKAARQCHISIATISKQINYLEKWCDQRLLQRTTRSVKLNEAGEKFYQEAKLIIDKTQALRQVEKITEKPHGVIRLNIPSTFNEGLLLPCIFKFLKLYPELNLIVSSNPSLDELVDGKTDIVITLKKPHSVDIKSFKLFEIKRGLFAAPSYLKNNRTKTLNDLRQQKCLIFSDKFQPNVWSFANKKKLSITGQLTADHFSLLKHAAIAGMGVLNIAENFVGTELKTGALVPILTSHKSVEAELYAYSMRHRATFTLQTFLDYLAKYKFI